MHTLIYDLQLAAWISYRYSDLLEAAKDARQADLTRKGFYPYSYNFIRRRREEDAQCSYCGRFVSMKDMTRDHIWPKSLGGEITTTACYNCNTRKRDMKPVEWAIYLSEHIMPH